MIFILLANECVADKISVWDQVREECVLGGCQWESEDCEYE